MLFESLFENIINIIIDRLNPGKIGSTPSQNKPLSFIYFDKYQKNDRPALPIILTKASFEGSLLLPTNEEKTGTSKAGAPIDPNSRQITTTNEKTTAPHTASTAGIIGPNLR